MFAALKRMLSPGSLDTSLEIDYRGCHAGTRKYGERDHDGDDRLRMGDFPKSITLRGSRWRTRVEQALTVRFYEPGRNIEEVRKSRVRRFSPASLRSH